MRAYCVPDSVVEVRDIPADIMAKYSCPPGLALKIVFISQGC